MWHLYGLSPVWSLRCVVRFPDQLNALSHAWHLYGFSPVWILLCLARFPTSVNRLLQTTHSNGFSPEWLRLSIARSLSSWQHLPHSVHLYLLVWIFLCWRRPLRVKKTFFTLSTWIQVFFSVSFSVFSQTVFPCKPFVTHCTHIWSWLVIMWMLSDISAISFSLCLHQSPCT